MTPERPICLDPRQPLQRTRTPFGAEALHEEAEEAKKASATRALLRPVLRALSFKYAQGVRYGFVDRSSEVKYSSLALRRPQECFLREADPKDEIGAILPLTYTNSLTATWNREHSAARSTRCSFA